MKLLFKIAIRNIIKKRKRTIITLLTVVIGANISIMTNGLIAGIQEAIKNSVTLTMMGDFQVHAKGYLSKFEAMPLNLNLQEGCDVEKLIKAQPETIEFTRRINFGGLLYSNEEQSRVFKGIAVDPEAELKICPKLKEFIIEGRFISNQKNYEVLISKDLANGLNLRLNSEISLVCKDKYNILNPIDVRVVGFMGSNLPGFSKKLLYINIHAAQKFLRIPNKYSELVARSKSLEQSQLIFKRLKNQMINRGIKSEIHFWDEIVPFFQKILDFQQIIADIIPVIFLFIVCTGIVNTMLMEFFERVNEICVMRVLGIKPIEIFQIFYLESLSLVGVGGVIGIGLGILMISILNIVGIEFYPPGSNLLVKIHPCISVIEALKVFFFVIIIGSLASIYPAVMSYKLRPTQELIYE